MNVTHFFSVEIHTLDRALLLHSRSLKQSSVFCSIFLASGFIALVPSESNYGAQHRSQKKVKLSTRTIVVGSVATFDGAEAVTIPSASVGALNSRF